MKVLKRLCFVAFAVLVACILLALVPINSERIALFETERIIRGLEESLADSVDEAPVSFNMVIMDESLLPIGNRLGELASIGKGRDSDSGTLSLNRSGWLITAELSRQGKSAVSASITSIRWTSLLPAILAVTLAIATRRLLISLLAGVAIGAALLQVDGSFFSPLYGVSAGTATTIARVFVDDFRLYIFLFTFALIGMVNIATASGGMAGLAAALGRLAKGSRSTQAATALLGLAVFFDDYSNTIVIGSSMRPLSDRAKVSREKLAYIVDSTAAPIAGLALVSTWIGYEVSLIGDAMTELQLAGSPYSMFLSTLPFRFYCIMAIVFVLLTIISGRDFGPMHRAQQRSLKLGQLLAPGSVPLSGTNPPEVRGLPMAVNAVLPVLLVIIAVLTGMAANGAGLIGPGGFDSSVIDNFDSSRIWRLQGNYLIACQDGGWVLAMASLAGSTLALVMGVFLGKASFLSLVKAWLSSWRVLILAFSVLVLAWSIGDINNQLGTGSFLVAALADSLPAWLLPVIIFVLGAFISFSTGSSWGTMAVLLPAAVPLAYHIGSTELMIVSIGAVLDGSIWGDHCSPLSDTTIMSSIASGCDHMDHVKTQFPYASLVAVAAIAAGYFQATYLHPLLSYLIAATLLSLFLLCLGKRCKS